MKVAVVAAAMMIGFVQQPTKPTVPAGTSASRPAVTAASAKRADVTAQSATQADPATTASQRSNLPSANTGGNAAVETKLIWLAEGLAAVAALQLFTLLWQGIAIRKMLGGVGSHAQEMEYQSRVLDGLLKAMTDQLGALQDTASAAKDSAESAREHVSLIASKERARLRIELQPFFLNYDAPSPASFTIQHLGSTDAFVLNSRAVVYVSDSKDPDRAASNGRPLPIPSIISAKNPVVVAQDVLHPFSDEEIENIRQLKSFVHFTGFIKYKDVFDGEHETRFNRVWSIAQMNNLSGEPFTYWEHCGAAEENTET